jgi:hypothetical protein
MRTITRRELNERMANDGLTLVEVLDSKAQVSPALGWLG